MRLLTPRPTNPETSSATPRRPFGWIGAAVALVVVLLFTLVFVALSHGKGPASGVQHSARHAATGARPVATALPIGGWSAAYLGQDGRLHVVSLDSKQDSAGPTLPNTGYITHPSLGWAATAASSDGRTVAYIAGDPTGGQTVTVVDVATGKVSTTPVNGENLYWSPDSAHLAVDSGLATNATAVSIISTQDGKLTSVTAKYQGQPASVFHIVGWIDATHLAVIASPPGATGLVPAVAAGAGAHTLSFASPHSGGPSIELAALDTTSGALRAIIGLSKPPDVFLTPDGTEAFIAPSTWQPTGSVVDVATGTMHPLPLISGTFATKFVNIGNIDFAKGGNWASAMAWEPGTHTLAMSLAAFGEGVEGGPMIARQQAGIWLLDLDHDIATTLTTDTYPLAWLPGGQTLLMSDFPSSSGTLFGALSTGPTLSALAPVAATSPRTVLAHGMQVFFGLVRTS